MEALPSSQALEDVPPIFRKPDDTQWSIFVQSDGMVGRPRLARTLKKAGAIICSGPKEAQVILVNTHSHQGRQFIRDWGGDTNKVVLEHSWVQTSIAAGKVLNEDDNWGGCLTIDDGLPIGEDESDDVVNSLPSPPPRAATEQVIEQPPVASEAQATQASEMSKESFPNGATHNSPGFPHNQDHLYNMLQIPPQLLASQWSHQMLLSMLSAQYPSGPNNGLSNGMSTYPVPPVGHVAPAAPSWPFPSGENVHQQLSNPTTGLLAPGQYLGESPTIPNDFTPSNTAPRPSQNHRDSLTTAHVSPAAHRGERNSTSAAPSSASRSSFTPCPASTSTPSSRPPTHLRSTIFQSETGEALLFFADPGMNGHNALVSAIKKNGGKITCDFPAADYIVLASHTKDFKNYFESALAANKPAVRTSLVYDSVEQNKLLDPSEYACPAPVLGKRGAPSLGKRKKEVEDDEFPGGKVGRKRIEENNTNPETKQVNKAAQGSVGQNSRKLPPTITKAGRRSPTPPPAHTRLPLEGRRGYYRYPEEERSYAIRYMRVLLERDHEMTNIAISQRLFQKMPHHSARSWGAFLTQNIRDEAAQLRKRASIAYRKEQHAQSTNVSASTEVTHDEDGSSEIASPAATIEGGVEMEALQAQAFENDLETVSQYFALGGGDSSEERDEVIWARLTEQTRCKTAATWEEFYNKHHLEVNARYKKLCQADYEDAGGESIASPRTSPDSEFP